MSETEMPVTETIPELRETQSLHTLNIRHRLSTEKGFINETVPTGKSDSDLCQKREIDVTENDVETVKHQDGTTNSEAGNEEGEPVKKRKRQRHPRKLEKLTFMCTSALMVILSHAVLSFQWLLPYLYVGVTPFIIGIRLAMYWKKQWQHFMLDFCYYANIICFVFLCMPDNPVIFSVMFTLSTGPLMWAVFVYQKSLVLHRIDKVTSTYLHMLPPLISFTIRWYPTEASKYWFREFLQETDDLPLTWTYMLPFSVFLCYSVIYAIVDNFLWDHKASTTAIRRREDVNDGAALHSFFYCIDERCRCLMFYIRVWIFCLLTMIGCQLCLYSYTANYIFVSALGLVAVWNGGSYYVHVFSVNGFSGEREDIKNI